MKVAIYDDELLVCKLIHHLIDWDELNLEFAGFEHDGITAYQKTINEDIDIVITDIRMPGYDGIELIKRIKSERESVEFIVISGYSEFEYTKSAIKFGVRDYILKPVNKKELNDTLIAVKNKIEQQKLQSVQNDSMKKYISKQKQVLRDENVKELFADQSNTVNLSFEDYFYIPMICALDGNADDVDLVVKDVFSIINKIENIGIYGTTIENNKIKLLLVSKNANKFISDVETHLVHIIQSTAHISDVKISFAVGNVSSNQGVLKKQIKLVEDLIYERLIRDKYILFQNNVVSVNDSYTDLYQAYRVRFEEAISFLDKRLLEIVFKEMINDIELLKNKKSGKSLYMFLMEIVDILQMSFLQFRDTCEEVSNFYQIKKHLEYQKSDQLIIENIQHTANQYIDKINQIKEQIEYKPIRLAKKYIQDHYQEPITLKEVSSFVNLNSSYFSQLFKQQEGKNFTDYLLEVRMEQAKSLIKSTQMSISDICVYVGYTDTKNFTKKFKQFTGLKPSEYRKLHG